MYCFTPYPAADTTLHAHHRGGSIDDEVDSLSLDFENEAHALRDMVTGRLFQLKQKLYVANHVAMTEAREHFDRETARRVRVWHYQYFIRGP